MYLNNFTADDATTRKIAVTQSAVDFPCITRDTSKSPPYGYNAVQICNTGDKAAFIRFGVDDTVTAVAPTTAPILGDLPIPAGAIMVFQARKAHYSVVCESGESTTIFVTFGYGN